MIKVSAVSINFQKVSIDDSSIQSFIVTNDAAYAVNVTAVCSDSRYTLSFPTLFTLNSGASRTIYVTFHPDVAGTIAGLVTLTHNDPYSPAPVTVSLTGISVIPTIHLDKVSISYGNVTVSDSKTDHVILTNTSVDNVRLKIYLVTTTNSVFKETITTFILDHNTALDIPVSFVPVDASIQSGQLEIQTNAIVSSTFVSLAGTGIIAPNIKVSTESVVFGKQILGSQIQKKITVSNIGLSTLSISAISTTNGKFTVVPTNASIVSSGIKEVTITYKSVNPQTDIGDLVLVSDDPDTPSVIVKLSGEGVSPAISVQSALGFSNIPVGVPKQLSLVIRNNSSVVLTVTSLSFSSSQFYSDQTVPFTVGANYQKTINVVALLNTVGAVSGVLAISSNDYNLPVATVSLSAAGLISNIAISPTSLVFGSVAVGSTTQKVVGISNTGLAPLVISSIVPYISGSQDISSDFIVNPSAMTISPSSAAQLFISFSPVSVGDKSADVVLTNNDPDSPLIVVSCVGVAAVPILSLPVDSLDFGNVGVTDTKTIELQVNNNGFVDLLVSASCDQPTFTLNQTSLVIPAHASDKYLVKFSPPVLNPYASNMTLVTNDLNNLTKVVSLVGQGVNLPIASVSSSSLNFGKIQYGETKTMTFSLRNTGTSSLIYSIRITSNPIYLATPQSGTVSAGSSQTISVAFTPVSGEQLSATLILTTSDQNHIVLNVALVGSAYVGTLAWKDFNLEQIIPGQMKTIAEKITEVTGVLSDVLDIMKGILNTIKIFIIDVRDPIQILLKAIEVLIENLIHDLSASGIYVLGIPGSSFIKLPSLVDGTYIDLTNKNLPDKITTKYWIEIQNRQQYVMADDEDKELAFGSVSEFLDGIKGGSKTFKNKIVNSFDDVGDSKRPQFSEDAFVGGIVLAADSGNITNLLNSLEKLANIFKIEFKSQFNPPTNLTAVGGNGNIRLTFSPNDGLMPNSYLIWRSEVSGGEPVNEKPAIIDPNTQIAMEVQKKDEFGNAVTKYELIAVTTMVDQLKKLYKVDSVEANNMVKNASNYVRGLISNAGDFISAKFTYEDTTVVNGKSYYYVISSAGVLEDSVSTLTSKIKTSDEIIWIVNQNGDPKRAVDPHKVGLMVNGPFSTEVSAMSQISFQSVEAGMARCKNYRCSLYQEMTEDDYTVDLSKETIQQTLSKIPILSTINIKRKYKQGTGYVEVEIPRTNYTVTGKIVTFIKNEFNSGDAIITTYNYLSVKINTIKDEKYSIPTSSASLKVTFYLINKPINSPSVILLGLSIDQGVQYKVIDDLTGQIELDLRNYSFGGAGFAHLSFNANYEYFESEKSISDSFRCINPENSKAYFDPTQCNEGTTLCPAYENKNCFYNTGSECTNPYKSKRIVSGIISKVSSKPQPIRENIPFNTFWDPVYCQNGMTAQRCDGYSQVAPRAGFKGTPPDWFSFTLLDLVPDIKSAIKMMGDIIQSLLSGTDKFGDSILNFLNLIEMKIDNLQSFIDKIDSVLNMITENFSGPGFYLLWVPPSTGGNEYFKNAVSTAKGGPSSDIFGYTGGVVLLFGGPNGDPSVTTIKNALEALFG